jgi:hypothetical protein
MAQQKTNKPWHHNSIIGGVVLVVLGVIFLIQNYLHIDLLDKFWPLILVVVGLVVIYNSMRR